MIDDCESDLISECYDDFRFPATIYKGNTWRINMTKRNMYSDNFYKNFATPVRSVFVSKTVLNNVFKDKTATGIICTFAIDEKGAIGLIVESGWSDSIGLSAPVASIGSRTGKALQGLLGINEAYADTVTTTSALIYYSKIYCPPKCPSDSVKVDSVPRQHLKKTK